MKQTFNIIKLLIFVILLNTDLYSQVTEKGLSLLNPDEPGKRWAIIVGINKYMDTSIKPLEKAQTDAIDLAAKLEASGEFDYIFTFTDKSNDLLDPNLPTKTNIMKKIDTVLREAGENDFILFFFSGHGISDVSGNGYLISIDANLYDPFTTGVKVEDIISKLQIKGIKKNLIILDACREVINKDTKGLSEIGLKEKEYNEAVVSAIFYSTKSGYYSYESKDFPNGVFTHFLLEGMNGEADKDNNGVITLSELEQYVQYSVNDWAIRNSKQQKPFTKIVNEKFGDLGIAKSPIKKIEDKTDPNTSITLGPKMKSLIVPGWGQFANGERLKGSLIFVSFIGISGLLASSYNKFKTAEANYNNASNSVLFYPSDPALVGLGYLNSQSLFSSYHAETNNMKILSVSLIGIYTYNLIDIFLYSKQSKTSFYNKKEEGLQIVTFVQPLPFSNIFSYEKVFSINYSWRF